jgi:hypothetical protein
VKKLLHLKQWLTIEDTAHHLTLLFGEEVTEADVLQLALDGHLRLSVYFVNRARGQCGRVVPSDKAKWKVEWYPEDEGTGTKAVVIDDDKAIDYGEPPAPIAGVWDLTMLGAERRDVEHRYQQLTGGPAVTLHCLEGPIVCRDDGTYCQIMSHKSDHELFAPELFEEPHDHPFNFYPATGLPADSVLVVKISSLHAFEARLSEPSEKAEKPIGGRERNTLLVIVAALCKLAKIDVNRSSAAGKTIESETVAMGARVPSRTIEEHLKRIPEALDARST